MTLPASAQYFADPVAASQYAAYREAQIEEFGQFVADGLIVHGGVPIFADGQPVPASTVAAHPWLAERVRRVGSAPVVDRAGQLLLRRAELEAEAAAIEAELAAARVADIPVLDYDRLTVDQLKAELTTRGLPVSGSKPELIARLRADDETADNDEQEG
jgi:hypothetical protein